MANVLENAYHHFHLTMGLKQEHQKEFYDQKRHGDPYKVGDLMWLDPFPCSASWFFL